MAKIHDLKERVQYGYWEIRVYHGREQTPARAWQVRGKDDAGEQYGLAVKHASRDAAFPLWRVVLVYCVVTETAYEQDGTMY
jgi:hypothetical protein